MYSIPYEPAIPHLDIDPKEISCIYWQNDLYMILIVALFIINPNWIQQESGKQVLIYSDDGSDNAFLTTIKKIMNY